MNNETRRVPEEEILRQKEIMARVRGMLRSDVGKMKTAAMLYLLLPGRPVVYYGEELGMGGSGADENKRLPMLWSAQDASLLCNPPENADQAQKLKEGVDVQDGNPESLLNTYRTLIALRTQAPELERGVMTALDGGNDALCCFLVQDNDSAVAVIINASQTETIAVEPMKLIGASPDGFTGAQVLGTAGEVLTQDASVVTLSPVSCILLRL